MGNEYFCGQHTRLEEAQTHHGARVHQYIVRACFFFLSVNTLTVKIRYEVVWAETLKTYREMVAEEEWGTRDRISIPAVQTLTFKVMICSLHVGRAYV